MVMEKKYVLLRKHWMSEYAEKTGDVSVFDTKEYKDFIKHNGENEIVVSKEQYFEWLNKLKA